LDHATLESKRGFLVHMGQIHPALKPYMKGVHATLESWRDGKDKNGWSLKLPPVKEETDEVETGKSKKKGVGASRHAKARAKKRRRGATTFDAGAEMAPDWDMEDPLSWEEKFGNFNLSRFGEGGMDAPPPKVRPVKRLKDDLKALHELTDFEEPPRRKARLGKAARAVCGFGDASKDGFGASIDIDGKGVVWRSGVWNVSIREESSNFREFRNLVESIERFVASDDLRGHELFMFTDNSTAESPFFKGTSSSEKLFDLVLRLRKIEMEGNLTIYLIHVAGTRMIW
jgi:hypothetical protein